MADDQQTFRRATTAAGVGLAVQLALTIAMGLAALWGESAVLLSAMWHLLGGAPIWTILIFYYYQHSIERAEALEAQQLQQSDQSAIFSEQGESLSVARLRLRRIEKWGMGIVSVGAALYLLIAGLVMFMDTPHALEGLTRTQALTQSAMGDRASGLILMGLCAGIAFIAFVTARYVSGMTQVRAWQHLRGGASYLMGSALIALLLLIGALFFHFDNTTVIGWLGLVTPAIMMLIGVEILLTFLLNVYRPRVAGEFKRPAFDSRVLGLLTTPESLAKAVSEAVNYQFGFEISRSWFYQLLARSVTWLVAFGLLVLIAISSVVIVRPYEQAVVTRFGRMVGDGPMGPGLHFKAPWPITRAQKYEVGRMHSVGVGSVEAKTGQHVAILWTNTQHHVQGQESHESYMVTAPPLAKAESGAEGDEDRRASRMSLITADVVVQYRIDDLVEYVQSAAAPEMLLKAKAQRRVSAYFAAQDIDTLLTRGRIEAGQQLREQIQQDVDVANLGLQVVFVGITGIHPPQGTQPSPGGMPGGEPIGVADAFLEQIGALQEKQTAIQNAHKQAVKLLTDVAGSYDEALEIYDAIQALDTMRAAGDTTEQAIAQQEYELEQLLAQARGAAAQAIFDARAERWTTALGGRADAERFSAEIAVFDAAPKYYAWSQYLRVLASGMANARKTIIDADNTEPGVFTIDLTTTESLGKFLFEEGN
ncbi:MAG: SPFH domain-containing protein [Phycisphaeraceae bacterium]|jgi:membrane protease subunit HflK|nr:SPFH domain-containing protein [Phycisphaeraceae bacterium]